MDYLNLTTLNKCIAPFSLYAINKSKHRVIEANINHKQFKLIL